MSLTSYKKLIPTQMRNTIWGSYIDVFKSITDDVKRDKIDRIINQFDPYNGAMTAEDYQILANTKGFTISSYEGWTSEEEYLRREITTLVPRIVDRNHPKSYQYNLYCFNLKGSVYPLYYISGTYHPAYDWWTFNEIPDPLNILDSADDNLSYVAPFLLGRNIVELDRDQTLDMGTDIFYFPKATGLPAAFLDQTSGFTSLDSSSYIDSVTRQMILNYSYTMAENATEFLSYNTNQAMYNDFNGLRRATERIYFEPELDIYYHTNGTVYTKTYELFDRVGTTTVKSINIAGVLLDTDRIEIGNGTHVTLSGSITGVQSLVATIAAGEFEHFVAGDTTPEYIRRNLLNKCTFYDFTEVAFKNIAGNVILYATFPKIQFFKDMFANIKFNFRPI